MSETTPQKVNGRKAWTLRRPAPNVVSLTEAAQILIPAFDRSEQRVRVQTLARRGLRPAMYTGNGSRRYAWYNRAEVEQVAKHAAAALQTGPQAPAAPWPAPTPPPQAVAAALAPPAAPQPPLPPAAAAFWGMPTPPTPADDPLLSVYLRRVVEQNDTIIGLLHEIKAVWK